MAERRGAARAQTARVERSAGGVVFRRLGTRTRYLLIRDPYGNWGLPKGHIEHGETPTAAALREVAEETGLDALAVVAPLPTIDWFFRANGRLVHKICHFFLVESREGEPVPQETEGISECVWQPYGQALERLSYANARDVLRAAGEHTGEDVMEGEST